MLLQNMTFIAPPLSSQSGFSPASLLSFFIPLFKSTQDRAASWSSSIFAFVLNSRMITQLFLRSCVKTHIVRCGTLQKAWLMIVCCCEAILHITMYYGTAERAFSSGEKPLFMNSWTQHSCQPFELTTYVLASPQGG